jgi:hypothetical protein
LLDGDDQVKPPIGTMSPLSARTKHYHRVRIRSLIVQNPHISAEGIRKALELQGLTLDRHYIGSLPGVAEDPLD